MGYLSRLPVVWVKLKSTMGSTGEFHDISSMSGGYQ